MTLYYILAQLDHIGTWMEEPHPDRPDGRWPGTNPKEAAELFSKRMGYRAIRLLVIPQHRFHIHEIRP